MLDHVLAVRRDRCVEDEVLERLAGRGVELADVRPDGRLGSTQLQPARDLAGIDPAKLIFAEIGDWVGDVDHNRGSAETDRDTRHLILFGGRQIFLAKLRLTAAAFKQWHMHA